MKRINCRAELAELASELGVRPDWHEPDEQEVTVRIEGENFDNAGRWPEAEAHRSLGDREWKGEFCVVLIKGGEDVAVVNLASLFSMATDPDGPLR